eukprot:768602-Hanusia_phi.AAC.3
MGRRLKEEEIDVLMEEFDADNNGAYDLVINSCLPNKSDTDRLVKAEFEHMIRHLIGTKCPNVLDKAAHFDAPTLSSQLRNIAIGLLPTYFPVPYSAAPARFRMGRSLSITTPSCHVEYLPLALSSLNFVRPILPGTSPPGCYRDSVLHLLPGRIPYYEPLHAAAVQLARTQFDLSACLANIRIA